MSFHAEAPTAPIHAEAPTPASPGRGKDFALFGRKNPAPGWNAGKSWGRNLECERLTAEAGSRAYPGLIAPPAPRDRFVARTTLVCRERFIGLGLRTSLDDAVLTGLDATTITLSETATSLRPDLAGATWLVEVFVPNPAVAVKVAFATKNALMNNGLTVSDRTPLLAAGDIGVITRMAPEEAYPTACLRYFATGSLGAEDALLAVVALDPRETVLHAGLCVGGEWSWVR